jgi:flavin-dependent dehydrogenase
MPHFDLVIAGGGPAGSTIASLVKKYSPQLRVLLLEKAHFPRHHIGESMLAGTTPVLQEMGVYEAVERHGFVEKLGATYVWGQDRHPWGFEFRELSAQVTQRGYSLPEIYTKAWQVRRDEYDHILLKHGRDMGVEVREGAHVHAPLFDATNGRVTGVEFSEDGRRQTVTSDLFIDCTGQDALLGHVFALRQYDDVMNNYALYGYWQGAQWKFRYEGLPSVSRIFIATTPRGWIWCIPLRQDLVSIGFVTHRRLLRESAAKPEQLYLEEVRHCPEIGSVIEGATLVKAFPDQKHRVMAIQDWSYQSRQFAGDGWAMCGDAAGFVDPVLSSGAMLAHELGQKAAYTINSVFSANSDSQIKAYWDFYQETYRTNLKAYRDMASFWYSNNFSMESWWWQARRSLHDSKDSVGLTDVEAFNRIAMGYANRTESLSLFGSYPLHEAQNLVNGLFGQSGLEQKKAGRYEGRSLALHPKAQLGNGLYYFQGQVRKTRRVLMNERKAYLDLHPGEEILLRLFDGQHSLDDLNRAAGEMRLVEQRMPVRTGTELVVQLDEIGALA